MSPRPAEDVVAGGRPTLVAGCGSIGQRHLKNLASLRVGPLFVYDPDARRAAAAAAAAGAQVVRRIEDAPALAAAFVCAPPSCHVAVSHALLERDAHLFVEKPIADAMDGVEPLLADAARRGRHVMVGFNLRFHPMLQRMKRLLEEGAIGRPLGARIEFGQYLPDWHPWEDYRHGYSARRELGGGIVLDAVHEIDYARWLLGEVMSISARLGRLGDLAIDVEDTAAMILTHASGALSEIHVDYLQRAYARTCKIIGTDGTLWWDWHARAVRLFQASTGAWETFAEPDGFAINQTYLDEIRLFLAVVDGRAETFTDGREGARVLAVALAAKDASTTGATVIL